MDFDLNSIPLEERAKLLEQMPSLEVVPSPLLRVVGVGQISEAAGITVELIALEIRERGAILHWRAHSEVDLAWVEPVVEISDDAGIAYRAGLGSGGGGGRQWEGQTVIVPAPPSEGTLRILVPRFAAQRPMPGYGPLPPQEGPWRFEVALGT